MHESQHAVLGAVADRNKAAEHTPLHIQLVLSSQHVVAVKKLGGNPGVSPVG